MKSLVPGSAITMESVKQQLQRIDQEIARHGDDALLEAHKHRQETQDSYLVSVSKWADRVEEVKRQRNKAVWFLCKSRAAQPS
jgi:hypothetical protein